MIDEFGMVLVIFSLGWLIFYTAHLFEKEKGTTVSDTNENAETQQKNHWYEMYKLECLKTKELEAWIKENEED